MNDFFESDFEESERQMPIVGLKLPSVQLDYYQNNEIKSLNTDDWAGKWVALVFYPADFTFVCPTELQDLAHLYKEFRKEGAEVISVSTDTAYTHLAWHESSKAVGEVTFPMVGDPAAKLGRALGVYLEDEGLYLRGSFIIDPEGVIQAMEIHNNNIGRSGEELLRKLRAAKFVREHGGEVCPANWHPGEKTLKPGDDLVGKI